MGKYDKEFEARMQGMRFAYELAKDKGIDELEAEMKRRNITKIPLSVKQDELKHVWEELKENMYNNITVTFLYCLRDEFGFGKERVKRLVEKYKDVVQSVVDVDYMGEHYIRLDDYAVEVNEKLGMDLDINRIAASQDVFDEQGRDSQYHTANIDRVIVELRDKGFFDAADFLERKLD